MFQSLFKQSWFCLICVIKNKLVTFFNVDVALKYDTLYFLDSMFLLFLF